MQEAHHSTLLFLGHTVAQCDHPDEKKKQILCFKRSNITKMYRNDMFDALKGLTNKKLLTEQVVEKTFEFLMMREPYQNKKLFKSEPLITTVGELRKLHPLFNVSWQALINSQLLLQSGIQDDEPILIENPEVFRKLMEIFDTLEVE